MPRRSSASGSRRRPASDRRRLTRAEPIGGMERTPLRPWRSCGVETSRTTLRRPSPSSVRNRGVAASTGWRSGRPDRSPRPEWHASGTTPGSDSMTGPDTSASCGAYGHWCGSGAAPATWSPPVPTGGLARRLCELRNRLTLQRLVEDFDTDEALPSRSSSVATNRSRSKVTVPRYCSTWRPPARDRHAARHGPSGRPIGHRTHLAAESVPVCRIRPPVGGSRLRQPLSIALVGEQSEVLQHRSRLGDAPNLLRSEAE